MSSKLTLSPYFEQTKISNQHKTNILAYILNTALLCFYFVVLVLSKQKHLTTLTKVVATLMVAVLFQCFTDFSWQIYVTNYFDDQPNNWQTKFGLVFSMISQCVYMATMNIGMWMFAY